MGGGVGQGVQATSNIKQLCPRNSLNGEGDKDYGYDDSHGRQINQLSIREAQGQTMLQRGPADRGAALQSADIYSLVLMSAEISLMVAIAALHGAKMYKTDTTQAFYCDVEEDLYAGNGTRPIKAPVTWKAVFQQGIFYLENYWVS